MTKKKAKAFITEITGLDKFGSWSSNFKEVNEKNFCKSLGKKFATGASYQKGIGIIMQGDLGEKMSEFILESFPESVGDSFT